MREIKFRMFRDGRMQQVHTMYSKAQGIEESPLSDSPDYNFNFGEDNLMQFTGLKDKNGKDIYEGDIFKPISEGIDYYKVMFENGSFCLHHNYGYWGTLGRFFEIANKKEMDVDIEITGNIYQNPELINL